MIDRSRWAVALGLVLLLAACGPIRTITVGPFGEPGAMVSLVISDRTGWVRNVSLPDDPIAFDDLPSGPTVANVDGRRDVLRVAWLTGRCDSQATIDLSATDSTLFLAFQDSPVCQEQAGVPHRLDLELDHAVPAASVIVQTRSDDG